MDTDQSIRRGIYKAPLATSDSESKKTLRIHKQQQQQQQITRRRCRYWNGGGGMELLVGC